MNASKTDGDTGHQHPKSDIARAWRDHQDRQFALRGLMKIHGISREEALERQRAESDMSSAALDAC